MLILPVISWLGTAVAGTPSVTPHDLEPIARRLGCHVVACELPESPRLRRRGRLRLGADANLFGGLFRYDEDHFAAISRTLEGRVIDKRWSMQWSGTQCSIFSSRRHPVKLLVTDTSDTPWRGAPVYSRCFQKRWAQTLPYGELQTRASRGACPVIVSGERIWVEFAPASNLIVHIRTRAPAPKHALSVIERANAEVEILTLRRQQIMLEGQSILQNSKDLKSLEGFVAPGQGSDTALGLIREELGGMRAQVPTAAP